MNILHPLSTSHSAGTDRGTKYIGILDEWNDTKTLRPETSVVLLMQTWHLSGAITILIFLA